MKSIPEANLQKCNNDSRRVATQLWDKAFWLDVAYHVIGFKQSEDFISQLSSPSTLQAFWDCLLA